MTALDQAFELWEREWRRVTEEAFGAAPVAPPPGNPMEARADSWRRTLEALQSGGQPGHAWSHQAKQQAELIQ